MFRPRRLHPRPTPLSLTAALLVLAATAAASAQETEAPIAQPAPTEARLAPDDNLPDGESLQGGSFSYYLVAGATLRGRSSATGYQYDGAGCSHVTSGTGTGRILNTELDLPDGAIIKYLRVYFYDTSTTAGVTGYITRYQPGSATADLVSAGSTNAFADGYGFVVSSEITETVNNTAYAYTLIGWPGLSSSATQICGLRVAYYAPTLFRDGFETGDTSRWSNAVPLTEGRRGPARSTEPTPSAP